jgi:hypothetical protein
VKLVVPLLVGAVALAGARAARVSLHDSAEASAEPFVPSRSAAPYLSLGYRELAADLLLVRMIGYFGGQDSDAPAVAGLAEAVAALDPRYERIYDMGANAMTLARRGVDGPILLRAVALLERGMREFPDDWKLPYLAGQIYTQDLRSDDPAQRRAWDEKGTLLIESAIRKPGAPKEAALWAAVMRTRLGQHERAVQGLKELILISSDPANRKRLLEALAKLEEQDSAQIGAELLEAQERFARSWKAERPAVTATMYILLGPRIEPGFDMYDLATGGRDLLEHVEEPLEPLE